MIIAKENLEKQVELIKVTVEAADYATAVENTLKNYKKKANIPGFRPGMVPMSVIKKMYYKGILAEETYRIASSECYKYLQDNKIEFLGDPMPSDSQPTLNFETMESFEFHFKVGVASPITLELANLSLTKYKLSANDELREGYTNNLLNRFGQLVDVDVITKDEAVSVTLEQADLKIEDAYVGLISMNDDERAPFIGKKVGDVMEVNVNDLYKKTSQRASILSMKEEELANLNPEFTLTITRIRKFALPTLSPEFFEEAFPAGNVKNEAEFRTFVDTELQKDLDRECSFKFVMDTRDELIKEATVTLPEKFLQEWLFAINEGKFSKEEIEKEFPQFITMMSWDILRKKYATESGVKVEKEELLVEAKKLAKAQFAQYGMSNVDEAMLENYGNQILNNKEESRKIFDSLLDAKIVDYVTTKATIVEQDVTMDQFREIVMGSQK